MANKVIDLVAGGIFAAMFGDDSKIIRDAVKRVKRFCSYAQSRQNGWRDRYVAVLKDLTGFESVALFSTGAEATEAFWRCCRIYNGKPGIWGGLVDPDEAGLDSTKKMCDAMHGMTLGAMIMAGKMAWGDLGIFPELGGDWGKRFGTPPDRTSCMIMEPYHAPSAQFHKIDPTINRIQELQKTFPDILLCIDEIQGGFGRTGKLWAHQHYPAGMLKPDFITIGKLCGGGLPLSALLGPAEVMESDSVQQFGHLHSTHSGNPLMCAVGCTVIEEMQKQDLIDRSATVGMKMHQELSQFPVRTHGRGLMAGLEMQSKEETSQVVKIVSSKGVLCVDTGRKWIKIGPQLNIEEEKLFEGIKILKEAVEEVVSTRVPETCRDSSQGSEAVSSDLPGPGVPGDLPGAVDSGENGGLPGTGN